MGQEEGTDMSTPKEEAEAKLIAALAEPRLGEAKRIELQAQLRWIKENLSD